MKIVFFTMSMFRGGTERVIANLSNNYYSGGDHVSIITVLNSGPEYELSDGIRYRGLIAVNDYYSYGKIRTFPEIIKGYKLATHEENPDVILSFLPEPNIIASYCRKRIDIPVIGSERSNPYFVYNNLTKRKIVNFFYQGMDGFVFQSQGARDFFNNRIKNNSKIILNPINGVNIPERSQESINKTFVSVGRFTEEKNYPLLIKAFSVAHKYYPDYDLKIYGNCNNPDMKSLIEEEDAESFIHIMGESSDVLNEIKNSYGYISSSKSEGLSNALMEAMALGIPCIATDCPSGGSRALIENETNGLLIQNDDVNAMTEAIIKLIRLPDMAKNMGECAKKIRDKCSVAGIAKEWKNYIYECIQ